MAAALIIAAVILVLFVLYILSVKGTNGRIKQEFLKKPFAHRGLHSKTVPENSMEAFRLAKEKGYGVELDLHLTADGELAVIHDASLKRTAGSDVNIYDLTADKLSDYRLEGTEQRIPLFSEVLELFRGEVPLVVELKCDKGNAAALCKAACDMLDGYKGEYCIESFDPRCILWLKKNRPDIIRGQLCQNFLKDKYQGFFFNLFLTSMVTNALTRPDFVAFNYRHKNTFSFKAYTRLWRGQGVAWTIRSKDEYDKATSDGYPSIFETFEP